MSASRKFHFVIMAAQRKGVVNPLAENAGVSHKCLIEMSGKPLIEHVARAVSDSGLASKISVSIEEPSALDGVAYVNGLKDGGLLRIVPSGDNLFESVAGALSGPEDFPAIITTADNVLLTPEMLRHFCKSAPDYDAALAMIDKETLLAKYPDGQRNFHKFRDGEFSNCNLYAITSPEALSAARVFEGGGQFRKSLKRVVKAFGLVNMIAYRYAWFTRDRAIARIGKRFNINTGAVDMPFPEAPIDVDNERTMKVAADILAARYA